MIEADKTYPVEIVEAYICELDRKNNKGKMLQIILVGKNSQDGNMEYSLYMHGDYITSGDNTGRPLYEVVIESLQSLGMIGDSPDAVESLIGKTLNFVTGIDTYNGKDKVVVKYCNKPRNKASNSEVKSIWSSFIGESSPQKEQDKKEDTVKEDTKTEVISEDDDLSVFD